MNRTLSGQRYAVLAILCIAGAISSAQAAPSVTNVRGSQRTDASGLVDVYYDLSGGSGTMSVNVTFSNNSGSSWAVWPKFGTLSGDIGPGIANGTDKHVI
jgi:hypothetical protein